MTTPSPSIDRFHAFVNGWGFTLAMTTVYLLLLGLVTLHHEMWVDELQAWLIARDSASLTDLFHNLRYEGHPALFYLLLYVPAHLTWNPVWLQIINYCISGVAAWVLFSTKQLHWLLRLAIAFSFYLFYTYGVVARNYMLAALLLFAAARCLTADRPRPYWSAIFLALAINTHIFVVPIAVAIFAMYFVVPALKRRTKGGGQPGFSTVLGCAGILVASLFFAYLTVRPPADTYTPYYDYGQHLTFGDYTLMTEAKSWQLLLPVPEEFLRGSLGALLALRDRPSLLASLFSLLLLAIPVFALRTRTARIFLSGAYVLTFLTMAATVHLPALRHLGLLFSAVVVALLMDRSSSQISSQPTASYRLAWTFLGLCLCVHIAIDAGACYVDWNSPFSDAKDAAAWLNQAGLHANPLVFAPVSKAQSLLGYMQKDRAYYAICACYGSFVRFSRAWHLEQPLTAATLASISASAHLPTIVVSGVPFAPDETLSLGLRPLKFFDRKPIIAAERYFIYESGVR